jgi:hypothetical protein
MNIAVNYSINPKNCPAEAIRLVSNMPRDQTRSVSQRFMGNGRFRGAGDEIPPRVPTAGLKMKLSLNLGPRCRG